MLPFNLKKKLENFIKSKYQRSVFNSTDIYQRERLKKDIIEISKKKKSFHIKCDTCSFFNEEFKNRKKILIYYKKFNTNLFLKKKYDADLKKLSNKKSCLKTLQILSFQIYKLDKINNLQKLNTILKINDLILISYLNNKKLPKNLDKNFDLEYKLIKKIL